MAAELDLPFRVFDVNKPDLSEVGLLLQCAGPFSATGKPMIDACLREGVDYLDITGEIGVFEYAHDQHDRAVAKNVIVCPGVGFDVIPTDCVAATLKDALPDATHLALGFDSRMKMSPGTSKTSVESLGNGGKIRRGGKIVTVPMGSLSRQIDFGAGVKWAPAIPWGDVATAYYTTGIPNIELYVATSPSAKRGLTIVNILRPILRLSVLQQMMKGRAPKTGPSPESRERTPVHVWGEARNDAVTFPSCSHQGCQRVRPHRHRILGLRPAGADQSARRWLLHAVAARRRRSGHHAPRLQRLGGGITL